MSTDPPPPSPLTTTFDQFIDRQREVFHQWFDSLIVYSEDLRTQWKSFWNETNQRQLFFTIVFSFILLTILTLVLFEYRRVSKTLRQCCLVISQWTRSSLIRLRNLLLRTTTPSILSILLNSNSFLRQKFIREFHQSLNDNLKNGKVNFTHRSVSISPLLIDLVNGSHFDRLI